MENNTATDTVTLLDGGIGRQLLQMGAPFRQPEWSALALIEAPHFVRQAHEQFALAGSDILTTNSYAVVPYHIGKERFVADGASLAALSGQLAHDVAAQFGCQVAGSLPPLFGSYRPDLFVEEKAHALLRVLVDALDPYVDLWLAETLSAIAEAKVVLDMLLNDKRPVWISYTLQDGNPSPAGKPQLRSGESVPDAVQFAAEHGAAAILFNCSQPEVMAPAIDATQQELHHLGINLPIGVYANAFPAQRKDAQANLSIQEVRQNIDPSGYAVFAAGWHQQGARIIGGCCGIGPEHIAALHTMFKKNV
ncbi:homocysteine S-methyltransferase family protein [Desulfogranum marinum]|uniref:homocysteine S-methyltransferase family protein n=1 Tax=Desulfogranum marinum TaxID=453220 RepID=UPI0019647DB9|nr:homocysteine S-methyltransferase family protein [Desulfogranum marinum]MBM9513099.1 homocysteine S-methyltransferase family protein [Desulfogranum marinum]